jgi:hypothetical protein
LTIGEVGAMLRDAVQKQIVTCHMTAEEAAFWKSSAPALDIRLWGVKERAHINDPRALDQYGIPLTAFTLFVRKGEGCIEREF